MVRNVALPATALANALRSFETGGITFGDVQQELNRLLSSGASASRLMEVLQRREAIEPLPEQAFIAIAGLLNEAIERQAAAVQPADDTDPEKLLAGALASTPATATAPSAEPSPIAFANEPVDLRSTVESARRAVALAADLESAQNALESEQRKAEELRKALTANAISSDTMRSRLDQAVRESARVQSEAQTLRDLLSARDATLTQTMHSLGERDAQITGLREKHSDAVRSLETARGEAERHQAAALALRDALKSRNSDVVAGESKWAVREVELAARDAKLVVLNAEIVAQDDKLAGLEVECAARDAELLAQDEEIVSRDTTILALEQRYVDAEARLRAGVQQQSELRGAQARIDALSIELAAARAALRVEQDRADVVGGTAADEIKSREAAQAHAELALQEAARHAVEAQGLRDLLTAHDADMTALQRERAHALRTLETELNEVRDHAGSVAVSLKKQQELAAELAAKLQLTEARSAALRAELDSVAARVDAGAAGEAVKLSTLWTEFDAIDAFVGKMSSDPPAARRAAAAQAADAQPVQSARSAAAAQAAVPQRQASGSAWSKVTVWLQDMAARRSALWRLDGNARKAVAAAAAVAVLGLIAMLLLRPASDSPSASVDSPLRFAAGSVIQDCPTCPAMTVLPAGRFKQGAGSLVKDSVSFEKPQHWVRLAAMFAMSTNPVTVGEFRQFITATGRDLQGCDAYAGEWKHRPESSWLDPGFEQTALHPVTCVSWNDAVTYTQWLSTKTGHRYRLPSASEWEYAAFAGGDAVQPWGSKSANACAYANLADQAAAKRFPGWNIFACDDGYAFTSPVGSFKANAFGLTDLLGNVLQWTQDCWNADYVGAPVNGNARKDGDCAARELRGASWFSTPNYVRATFRNHFGVDYRTSSVGIRLVRELGS